MTPYEWVVCDLATATCRRLVRRIVRRLIAMTEGLQSGDDSPLTNVWDEICVQVQGEHSVMWSTYLMTIRQVCAAELAALPPFELSAIWLQTTTGVEWADSEEGEFGRVTPDPQDQDVVDHVLNEVVGIAGDWSNARIRQYQE